MIIFEDEGIISNIFPGNVDKGPQKQRKRVWNKESRVSWLRKRTIFAEAAELIAIKVKSRRGIKAAEDKQ